LQSKRESKHIDFKEGFDPSSRADWCEIIKDIIAIANSGGGIILIGLNNQGGPSGFDVSKVLELDQAVFSDKIYSYTDVHFSEVEVVELKKERKIIAAINIGSVRVPIVFTKPGSYPVTDREQKTAFGRGTIYFRHGAKSEPGNTGDVAETLERRLKEIRKEWIDGVRKVVQAPTGASINILPPEVHETDAPTATPIRIVEDPSAPVYHIVDPNKTHPYRQIEVIRELNKEPGERKLINSYDILAVRRMYEIDKSMKFYYKPAFGSPQYSIAFVEWLKTSYEKDHSFFTQAREFFSKQQKKDLEL